MKEDIPYYEKKLRGVTTETELLALIAELLIEIAELLIEILREV